MKEQKMIGDHINEMVTAAASNSDDVPLHEYVCKIRKYMGIKQELVASMVGATVHDISAFERGKTTLMKAEKDILKELFGKGQKPQKAIVDSTGKVCKTCEVQKPIDSFYLNARPGGTTKYRSAECKECSRERTEYNRVEKAKRDKEVSSWMNPTLAFSQGQRAS